MKTCTVFAAVAAASIAGFAAADFVEGASVAISGVAGPEFGGTFWGTDADQGTHTLGGVSNYWDPFFPSFAISVSSSVESPYSVTFQIDFSEFAPGDYSEHELVISGLKSDGSIAGVAGNSNGFSTDGNTIFWSGTGAELASLGTLSFKVFQVPAPGALALLGLAGLTRARRRRA